MNLKKVIKSIVFGLMFVLMFNSIAFANSNLKTNIMKKEYGRNYLTEEELQILKDDPALATERAKKDVQYLKEKGRKAFEQSVVQPSVAGLSPYSVSIGTDKTMNAMTDHDYGSSYTGLGNASAKANYSSRFADATCWTSGYGDAEAWSWVGARVNVTGSGSKLAYIRYNGSVKGSLVGGIGGSAEATVSVKIFDVTAGSWIGESTVYHESDSNNARKTCSQSINRSILVTLQAGHQYLFIEHVETTCSQYGVQISTVDFWNGGSGAEGIDATGITIDFV